MNYARKASLALLAVVFLFAAGVSAHHGTANYDTGKNVDVKGTVVDFQFVNPHVLIAIDVKGVDGKTTRYQGELTSPNRLSRLGWSKNSIKVGGYAHHRWVSHQERLAGNLDSKSHAGQRR